MKKLLLIVNPYAGQRRVNRYLPDMLRLFHDRGFRCEVYVTGASGDATRYVAEYGEGFDQIVCAGGDGTLNETIAGMLTAGLKCPLGYVPCGTTNDYASSIGLSSDIMEAARDVMTGEARTFDVGVFNGRYFVYTATCGAFAKASYSTPQAAKNVLGHMAYVLEGVKDLGNLRPIHMRVETEEYDLDDDFLFCSITNSTSVGGILKLDTQLVALNDGKFEVTLVRNPATPAQLSTILYGLTTMDIPNEMIHFFSAPKLTVRCAEPVEWTLDGEREPETEAVTLENRHAAIRMFVPTQAWESPLIAADEGEGEV
ncbi:MAG: diacylglycerol kinase family lipid kinase [Clostridia bacterium]|nr:diacylglycerol kinase family lipid kinase [Clostridia bacterium]